MPAVKHSWWAQLPTFGKVALISGAAVVLCCGGLTTLGAIIGSPDPAPSKATVAVATSPAVSDAEVAGEPLAALGDPSTTAGVAPTDEVTAEPLATLGVPSTAAEATPTIEKRTVTQTQSIPYPTKRVNDSSLAKGTTRVRTRGVAGVKILTYEVTFTNGVQTSKRLVQTETTRKPVTEVIAVGTKQAQRCDPNYSGACVPIASDVDCAGGGGNGPAYVQGPVKVVGTDIYDLDRDGDGIGCE